VPQPLPAVPPERGSQAASSPTVAPPPADREMAPHLLKKGEEQLAQGFVAPARLLFERAADLGLCTGGDGPAEASIMFISGRHNQFLRPTSGRRERAGA